MIDKEELQYWIQEFGDSLDPEDIEELLEAVGMDEGLEGARSFSDFNSENQANVFPNLNKRKHFDIDD